MADKVAQSTKQEYDRACLLVGRFIYHWALLESAVNDGIGKLLSMGTLEETIVTANLNFFAKTNILKSWVNLKGGKADWAKSAIKDIEAMGDLARDRNIVAHNVFGPHAGDKVHFLYAKAKSKLTFPKTIWGYDDFAERWNKARELRKRMEALVERMTRKGPTLGELMLEYAKKQPPEQVHENYLGRLLLGSLGSPLTTSEESPQTPRKPEGE